MNLSFELNGRPIAIRVAGHHRLIDLLRDVLGQPGTKEGCGEGECGACTVLVNGQAVNSCLFPAPEVEGRQVTTIEGVLRAGSRLSAVQRAFVENGGVQCGFCSPGMVMTTVALLGENPDPSAAQIRDALSGNLCRCTGYVPIIKSIQRAARAVREESSE